MLTILLTAWGLPAILTLLILLWQNKHDLFTRPVQPSGFVVLVFLSSFWFLYWPWEWWGPKD